MQQRETPEPIALRADQVALFASDMHLGDDAPETADLFLALLDANAPQATHLFLLGDVFEAWIGDDGADAVSERVVTHIAALADGGLQVFVMRGNRDFLLDVPMDAPGAPPAPDPSAPIRFAARIGARMIEDPCTIDLFGSIALLCHGDALCTDDADYQRFRALIREPAWQRDFLARPLEERTAIGRDLRSRSELSKGSKAHYLMDVNPAATERAMREAGATLMIHGHTHRPSLHRMDIDGTQALRWVLPDWDAHAGRGGMLRATGHGLETIGPWPAA